VSVLLVEHRPEALADTRSRAVGRQASDLEAEAEVLELQAAELRKSAERLSDRARHLRTMARRFRGDLRSNRSCPDDGADLRRASSSRRRALLELTPRQREIVILIACGRTNRQIAQELVITVGTAANHVAQVLDRLGLDNRAQVAAWAVEHREVWHDRTDGKLTLGQARLE
jgi:DNA-binding NarL/FixJ family response regulator